MNFLVMLALGDRNFTLRHVFIVLSLDMDLLVTAENTRFTLSQDILWQDQLKVS